MPIATKPARVPIRIATTIIKVCSVSFALSTKEVVFTEKNLWI
jgi:hypothetical protein